MEILNCEQLLSSISMSFNFHNDIDAITVSILSEYIRATIALEIINSKKFTDSKKSVPTYRVTQPARIRMGEIFKASVVEQQDALYELNTLNEISDLIKIENGWSLAPQRLIEIDPSHFLIVGGGPIQMLPEDIRTSVNFYGRTRIISYNIRTQAYIDSQPKQRFIDLVKFCYSNFSLWSTSFINSSIPKMVPIDIEDNVYVYESHRWVNISDSREELPYFLFRVQVGGSKKKTFSYGLGRKSFDHTRAQKITTGVEIDKNIARRLQVLICDSRPQVKLRISGELVHLIIPFPIPSPECNFLSYGWTDPYLTRSKWPREYRFPFKLFPLIKLFFNHMGFELTNQDRSLKYE